MAEIRSQVYRSELRACALTPQALPAPPGTALPSKRTLTPAALPRPCPPPKTIPLETISNVGIIR